MSHYPTKAAALAVVVEAEHRRVPESPQPDPRTWRTLADVPDDPPRDLLLGMLEPDGPTLAYAAPGTGKGMTGAWVAVAAQRTGMRPCIFDAERRPREWSRRVSGLGGDRTSVVYMEPSDLPARCRGRPLWECAGAIRDIVRAAGGDLLLVDSVLPAVGLGEERLRSDASVPFRYVSALDFDRCPIAVVRPPAEGSARRRAVRLVRVGSPPCDSRGSAPAAKGADTSSAGARRSVTSEAISPASFSPSTTASTVDHARSFRADDEESTREWLLATLADGPKTVAAMAQDLYETLESPSANEVDRIKERLSKSLNRMKKAGDVVRTGVSRPEGPVGTAARAGG